MQNSINTSFFLNKKYIAIYTKYIHHKKTAHFKISIGNYHQNC